jgi:hypothetical protein
MSDYCILRNTGQSDKIRCQFWAPQSVGLWRLQRMWIVHTYMYMGIQAVLEEWNICNLSPQKFNIKFSYTSVVCLYCQTASPTQSQAFNNLIPHLHSTSTYVTMDTPHGYACTEHLWHNRDSTMRGSSFVQYYCCLVCVVAFHTQFDVKTSNHTHFRIECIVLWSNNMT